MLHKDGGEAQEALGLRKGASATVVESVNGHAVATLEELRRHFLPEHCLGNVSMGIPAEVALSARTDAPRCCRRRLRVPAATAAPPRGQRLPVVHAHSCG